jgi:hypothetical protein
MISNSTPFGTVISATSPTFLPSNPFPIGEVTDIFRFQISFTFSNKSIFHSIPLDWFFILH